MVISLLICPLNHKLIIILGKITIPSVSGQCCPSISYFTINKINGNKGIIFGGVVGATKGVPTNNVYIFNVTHNTIVS